MGVRQTSLEAYRELNYSGVLGKNQLIIYNTISTNPDITDLKIAQSLGFNINQVTGRRNELMKKGLVESTQKVLSPTGRTVHAWKIT